MSSQQSNQSIKHSWFGHFYRGKPDAGKLTNSGITFYRCKGRFTTEHPAINSTNNELSFKWEELDSPPTFKLSSLGFIISFNVSGTAYQIPYLSYFSHFQFGVKTKQLWARLNGLRVCELVAKVEQITTSVYPRQSRIEMVQARVQREYQRWFPWCENMPLANDIKTALAKLKQIHSWDQADIEKLRERYIQSQLSKYADFFKHVESKPLTDMQRRACVVDDNNNLLLAGAGTGKTSVMVGRAGYLIKSGQAQADEILLLAYGRKAADEMDERIKNKLNTDDIKASTFHSLGLRIIAEVEGKAPSLSLWAEDEKAKDSWVQSTLETLIEDQAYRKQLFEYFSQYYYVEKSQFDFDSLGDYFQYLTDNDIRTLKGERVKSFGELYIANWLFSHGIEYKYEAKYEHEVSTVDFSQYQPDFYLPDYGVYIEYYGIDEDDRTAPYIDNQQYLESMEWKRQLHNEHDTVCLELFYHQHKKGLLIKQLEDQIKTLEIKESPLPDEAILATLNELGRVTELAKLFSKLIGLYKSACLDSHGLEMVFSNAADAKQTRKAFELLEPILSRYQQQLSASGDIDFEDMIGKALGYIQQGQFLSPWRYIMVDEFQDISEPRARLVKALRDSCLPGGKPKASLFCVGDDWQAIYRFSGADVSLTTQFTEYFGPTAKTYLDETFRFNNSIGDVATQFVTKNPVQLKKDIRSNSTVDYPAVSLIRRGAQEPANQDEPSLNALEQALNAINKRVEKVEDELSTKSKAQPVVYLLARFWFQLPDNVELKQLNRRYPKLTIQCQSFHASKGKEADYVVVMGMQTGKNGFPSMKVTPPILDAFLPKAEAFEFAEERRLFYVALTRAKHRAYVLADMTDVSPFVIELLKENYAIEQDEFTTSLVQQIFEDISCVRCTTGTLKPRVGNFKSFFSCSHFPLCDHKEEGCELCGGPMTRKRFTGFKVCLNDSCGHTAPVCSVCGGDMKLRKGPYSEFWGCINFRRDAPVSCSHKINKQVAMSLLAQSKK
ncbi:UvrD-helicase domain-containing protein [Shewanella gaetbuli]|uniref:DNA 3'-5' helicase n=1 Tax=Shewanella gaetbuli TaxID=220752 RepID=A0A9X2CHN5_9GAMM|nr:UvrD-helicase domain-containing protein [Shewanella gaetbuli]MCL1143703.1 UvrD-helicase domain-containing protein [Shewanella gaetbuli]